MGEIRDERRKRECKPGSKKERPSPVRKLDFVLSFTCDERIKAAPGSARVWQQLWRLQFAAFVSAHFFAVLETLAKAPAGNVWLAV
jgi:hypothetical protein